MWILDVQRGIRWKRDRVRTQIGDRHERNRRNTDDVVASGNNCSSCLRIDGIKENNNMKHAILIILIAVSLSLAATGCITYNEANDPADPEVVYVMQTPEIVYVTPTPDPCKGVECYPVCIGVDKHSQVCEDGECIFDGGVEINSPDCGYVPTPVRTPEPTFDAAYPITVIFEWECGGIWMITFENDHTATSINVDSGAHGDQPCYISIDTPSMRKYIIDQDDNNVHIVLYRGGLATYQSGNPGSISGDGEIDRGRWY